MKNEIKFSENEIRPDILMADQKIAATIDIGRLLIHAKDFIKVNCPACNNADYKPKYLKSGLNFSECNNCGTIFTNPRPTPKILEEFYKYSDNYEYWNTHIFPASEEIRRAKIFVPRVNKVLDYCDKYNVNTDSLLEVGCGFGTFCVEMQSRNRFGKIVGVEPTPGLAQTSRQKGIEVIEDLIENIHFDAQDRFDVLVNFEVIEHIFSPKDFIINSKKLLKKGGLFITTCPNGKGFDFTVLGEKCSSLDHEHLNYFNPKSLSDLLKSIGFDVLESITPGKLDAELVRNQILEGTFDLNSQQFLKQVLIDEWESKGEVFQQFLSDAGLSSHMWIIARNT